MKNPDLSKTIELLKLNNKLNNKFSCKICKMLKNTYFEEHLRTTASGFSSVT